MDTRTDLVEELRKLAPSRQRDALIRDAIAGAFHDFKSESASPKRDLTRRLAYLAGLNGETERCAALAARVMRGDFDESPDDADKAELRALFPGLTPDDGDA